MSSPQHPGKDGGDAARHDVQQQAADISPADAAAALLRWYAEAGVDEAVGATPANFFSWKAPERPFLSQNNTSKAGATPSVASTREHRRQQEQTARPVAVVAAAAPVDEAVVAARAVAAACRTFEDLGAAVAAFDGCPLKKGARNTVFADGAPDADLLVIGEAPGRDEDRIGKPFVGRAGQLLDRMLAAIDRGREKDTLISNVVYWRPPGNRTPTQNEVMICRPFVDRLIEIIRPKAILLAGGAPTQALTGQSGIMRSRGRWKTVETASGFSAPALPVFHPAFLLRQPQQKRLAWTDLQNLKARLTDG